MTLQGKSLELGPLRIEVTRHDERGFEAKLTLTFAGSNTQPDAEPPVHTETHPLQLLEPDYDPVTGVIVFRVEGGDNTAAEFMAIGVTGWTTKRAHTIDKGLRNDLTAEPIKILARQSDKIVELTYNLHPDQPRVVPTSPANSTIAPPVQKIFSPETVIRSNPDIMNLVQQWQNGKARLIDTANPERGPGERQMYFLSGSDAVSELPTGFVFEDGDELTVYKVIGRNADVYQDEWNRKADWTVKFKNPDADTGN